MNKNGQQKDSMLMSWNTKDMETALGVCPKAVA